MKITMRLLVLVAGLTGACAPSEPEGPGSVALSEPPSAQGEAAPPAAPRAARMVDPRQGGFEVGFGEFAVTLEAPAIKPGPVTFEVLNGGKLVHGFEMEIEGVDDSSGHGGDDEDGFEIETNTFEPGETLRVDLDLAPGLYKMECFVANHDDLGMEIMLEVRQDAPKVRQETVGASGDTVSITGFAFDPADLQVASGTEVTWTNDDPTPHTVTADDGSFDSGTVEPGATFAVAVDGSITYFCAIHPSMKGSLTVA